MAESGSDVLIKGGILFGMSIVLLIPLALLLGLVSERTSLREEAYARVAHGYGGAQVIGGPLLVVPVHAVNILLVASVFRLRRRLGPPAAYRAPGYPLVPAVYVCVLALFLVAAIAYNPRDTLIGMAMTATALPVYVWIRAQGRP